MSIRKIWAFALLVLVSPPGYSQECPDPQQLGAVYEISSVGGANNTAHQFTLWRKPRLVAHVRSDQGVTDVWNRLSDGRTRPVRYFDEYQRGIEYQPGEVKSQSWEIQNQLLSGEWLQSLSLQAEKGTGCWREQYYKVSLPNQPERDLVWLPELNLVKSFDQVSGTQVRHWQLVQTISDPAVVAQIFAQREAYKTTDFIDIGDNETDPFLRRMINLGFVEHGAEGFYDAAGNTLNNGHAH